MVLSLQFQTHPFFVMEGMALFEMDDINAGLPMTHKQKT